MAGIYDKGVCENNVATPLDLNGRAEPAAGGGAGGTVDAPDDREFVVMQDDNGGVITQFLRRFTLDDAGAMTVTDVALDGTTIYAPTGTVSALGSSGQVEVIGTAAADRKDAQILTKEYVGAATVTRANVLTDLGSVALIEVDILVRQVDNVNDTVELTMGGNTVSLPLGASTTLRAPEGHRLDDFSIALDANEAVNITAQGVS